MDQSPLGRLSAELRNNIYERSLHEVVPIPLTRHTGIEPGLLRTCRLIRTEAILLFYSLNEFRCSTHLNESTNNSLIRWLKQGPSQKFALIHLLHIEIEVNMSGFSTSFASTLSASVGFAIGACNLIERLHELSAGDRKAEQIVRFRVNSWGPYSPNKRLEEHLSSLNWHCKRLAICANLGMAYPGRALEALKTDDFKAITDMMRAANYARSDLDGYWDAQVL